MTRWDVNKDGTGGTVMLMSVQKISKANWISSLVIAIIQLCFYIKPNVMNKMLVSLAHEIIC